MEQNIVIETKGEGMQNRMDMPSSMTVSSPGKLRIESKSPAGAVLIVSDGSQTWMYFDKHPRIL